jgi:hypothetical protein
MGIAMPNASVYQDYPASDPEGPVDTSPSSLWFEARCVVPVSEEPYWLAVIGPKLTQSVWRGTDLATDGKGETAENREPWIEPIVFKRIGHVKPNGTHVFGEVDYPSWDSSEPASLEGKFVDQQGRPAVGIMTLYPQGEGVGAIVYSSTEGKYRIKGLSPGTYRASLLAENPGSRFEQVNRPDLSSPGALGILLASLTADILLWEHVLCRQFELEVPAQPTHRDIVIE